MATEKRASVTQPLILNRLPTLSEVLMRRTRPPLDLFCFFIYLLQQGEGIHYNLDFWLDVQHHENLCRAFFKDVRKSGRSIQQVWPEYYHHARSHGSIFSSVAGLNELEKSPRIDEEKPTATGGETSDYYSDDPTAGRRSPGLRRDTESHGPSAYPGIGLGVAGRTTPVGGSPNMEGKEQQRAPSRAGSLFGGAGRRVSKAPTVIPRGEAITLEALVESGERIYARYLVGGAEKEIYLPPSIRIHDFPSSSLSSHPSPLIPDYFHAAKNFVFKGLEEDAFPRFLRAKAFGNLTPMSGYIDLFGGLFCLWAGLVVAFTLVFLDYKPKITRLYLIIPFFLAFYLLLASFYHLSPLLVLFRLSETRTFETIKIREKYVLKILQGRAAMIMAEAVVATAVMTVIWWAVPGKRL